MENSVNREKFLEDLTELEQYYKMKNFNRDTKEGEELYRNALLNKLIQIHSYSCVDATTSDLDRHKDLSKAVIEYLNIKPH